MSVASSLALGFTGFLLYESEPGNTLFTYHPALMTIAYSLLVFESVQIFNKSNPVRSVLPVRTITFHWFLSTLALLCVTGGMYAVFQHKENLGKAHFASTHAKLGLVANSGLFLIAIGGVLTLYRKTLGISKLVKQGHVIGGAVVYVAGIGALLTGLSSDWFSNVVMVSAPFYWRAIYTLPIICAFVISMQVSLKLLRKLQKKDKSHKSD
ncbi:cytochrome b561 domain-containing protein 2 [Galendromus occidentalis]|uniref:ascorbate ferrireductase (transmembrane) n=1 Tax=Galendromus occidentalis TaxID=34638 RepID=A0AAJ6QW51_9ACAR|nr:cytochrome b561 domain-containing protein 2 [Galendromus occidentalis]